MFLTSSQVIDGDAAGVVLPIMIRTGKVVEDAKLRDRFSQLVIPPAWQEVWICRGENGHIQAVGRDEAGRKQYIYHPAWASVREQVKYSKLLAFGEALPELRQKVAADLRQRKLTQTKVTALVVALMEQTLIRIWQRRICA